MPPMSITSRPQVPTPSAIHQGQTHHQQAALTPDIFLLIWAPTTSINYTPPPTPSQVSFMSYSPPNLPHTTNTSHRATQTRLAFHHTITSSHQAKFIISHTSSYNLSFTNIHHSHLPPPPQAVRDNQNNTTPPTSPITHPQPLIPTTHPHHFHSCKADIKTSPPHPYNQSTKYTPLLTHPTSISTHQKPQSTNSTRGYFIHHPFKQSSPTPISIHITRWPGRGASYSKWRFFKIPHINNVTQQFSTQNIHSPPSPPHPLTFSINNHRTRTHL